METRLKEKTPACLWMQAGVVKQKKCIRDFLCTTCRFDRALRKVCHENEHHQKQSAILQGKKDNLVFWKEKLKKQPLARRPCIHHMKGRIDFKTCPKTYNCIDCEFDQYFHDQFKVYTVLKPVEFNDISGVSLPVGYYLHSGHTWVKIEDHNTVRIGIDDFASRVLGKFTTIKTPLMGKQVFQGKNAIHISRNGHKASFFSPVSGVITEVNSQVNQNPGLINHDPYIDGWVLSLYCPNLKQDLKQLMFMDSNKSFMNREVDRLYAFLEEETQLAAADGGRLGSDLFGNLPKISWNRLLKLFICKEP
ncbi:glycine cleavage system protein H [Desulfobacula sp.]|uniref:glycine cleavage system protein H n=1 Tax=Desulfobacula sp. TaxID=2593537 RepID=UPI002614E9F3|nr:glycine cleavage system protein H [Desulfobacula sp.]